MISVTIPNSVRSLGVRCFSDCPNLVDYQLYWETPPVTWNANLMPNNANTYFTIPNGITANYTAKGFPSDKLIEAIFTDEGVTASHNDSWIVTNGTMTRMDSYTRLVESAQTLMCQMNTGYITPTSIVEFDFKAVDGVKNWGLVYIRNSGGGDSLADLSLNNVGGEIGEWIHLKIVFNNTSTITIYSSKLDNPITKTLSSTSPNYRLLLYCGGANTELHFKNVKVYETINGVTNENG